MRARRGKGQSIAEFALLLPLLLLILLGCVDLGRAFTAWIALANGTREGARYGAVYPTVQADIEDRARREILVEGLSADALQVEATLPAAPGEPVVVTARYSMSLVTLFLFGGQPVTISARTQMAVLTGET